MDTIKVQANKVSQLIFASDTVGTYQRALTLTWDILRETALLIWLVICLIFVGGEWLWNTAIDLGQKGRAWYESLSDKKAEPGEPQSFESISKSVLSAGESGAAFLLYRAKQQLGIDADPPAPKTVRKPTETAKPVAATPAPPPAPVAPPAPVTPPTAESATTTEEE
ncbi:MAG: hypothetical protein ACFB0C_05880 [Leptolyngbyaceae cyanobacterium]